MATGSKKLDEKIKSLDGTYNAVRRLSKAETLAKYNSMNSFENNELSPQVYNVFSGEPAVTDPGKTTNTGILKELDITNDMSEVVGISTSTKQRSYDTKYFNRYRTIYPGDELVTGKHYMFIVKPDLNIIDAAAKDPYFANMMLTKPYIMQALTHLDIINSDLPTRTPNEDNHFISFLSNRAMSFSLPDYQVAEYKLDQPFTQFSTSYAGNSNEIRTNQSVQVQFRETENLDITALFDAWIKYIDLVSYGIVTPYYDYNTSAMYYGVPIIDYATSIYEIITKPDGTEIIYWAKITGVFPTTMPHSNYQYTYEDRMDNGIEIQFSGGLPETLNPKIFSDFNYNAGIFTDGGISNELPTQMRITNPKSVPHSQVFADVDGTPSGSSIVGAPFVTFDTLNKVYKLRWRPRS